MADHLVGLGWRQLRQPEHLADRSDLDGLIGMG